MYTKKVELKLTVISVALVIILVINGFLLLNVFSDIRTKKGQGFSEAKEYAFSLVEYHERVAKDWGVIEYSAVQNSLSKFMYDINLSTNNDELARIVLNQGSDVQSVIRREAEARQANIILSLISYDQRISSVLDPKRIGVSFNSAGELRISDEGLLAAETKVSIEEYVDSIPVLWERNLEIEVENGVARLTTFRSVEEREQSLKSEVDSLKAEIESLRIASGHAEMSGEGLTIRLYDNPDEFGNLYIVHDSDLRELVNELFSAGATGISVGGRRLTTTSSIRCVGPLIHVDYEPISVEPIVIQAVGNVENLESALALYVRSFIEPRGIVYQIDNEEKLTLPAYARRR